MTLGEFIISCMRAAGDPQGSVIHYDAVLKHCLNCVNFALGRIQVSVTEEVVIGEDDVASGYVVVDDIFPISVYKDGYEIKQVSRLNKSSDSGWYEEGGRLYLNMGLSAGDSLTLVGRVRKASWSEATPNSVLSARPSNDEIQWVPDAANDFVRYRLIQRIAEDIGQFERAQYFAQRAVIAEAEAVKSLMTDSQPNLIIAEDPLG